MFPWRELQVVLDDEGADVVFKSTVFDVIFITLLDTHFGEFGVSDTIMLFSTYGLLWHGRYTVQWEGLYGVMLRHLHIWLQGKHGYRASTAGVLNASLP